MFYSADKTEDLSLGHSISDSSETLLQRGKGGAGTYRSFCNEDQVVGTSKDYCFLFVFVFSLPKKWDRTRAPCSGSLESYPLDRQGSPKRLLSIKENQISR